MTNDEINSAVARKLGWKLIEYGEMKVSPACGVYCDHHWERGDEYKCKFRYSTSIAAAFEIIEKLQKDGFTLSLSWCTVGDHFEWILKIMGKEFTSEWADTAPLAICLAFLKLS